MAMGFVKLIVTIGTIVYLLSLNISPKHRNKQTPENIK